MQNANQINFIMLGGFFGCLIILNGFCITLSSIIKIPGSRGAKYWAWGSVLAAAANFSMSLLIDHLNVNAFMLILGVSAFSLILVYWGICIFENKKIKTFILIFSIPYFMACSGIYFYAQQPVVAVIFRSFMQVILWGLIFKEMLKPAKDELPNKLPVTIAAFGLLILLGSSCLRFYDAYLYCMLPDLQFDIQSHRPLYAGAFIGWIIFLSGQLLNLLARIKMQTHQHAMHDALTGLQNRRAIIQSAEREIALTKRNGQPLAVAFIDIDYFKNINDQYGHDQGDQALCAMANILRRTSRRVDLIGRYGGEEFCVIYPGVDHAGAKMAGERLLAAVRAYPFEGIPRFTISIGLALVPAGEKAFSWDQLVHLADIELYKAKQAGRDRYAILEQVVIPEQAAASATSAMA